MWHLPEVEWVFYHYVQQPPKFVCLSCQRAELWRSAAGCESDWQQRSSGGLKEPLPRAACETVVEHFKLFMSTNGLILGSKRFSGLLNGIMGWSF